MIDVHFYFFDLFFTVEYNRGEHWVYKLAAKTSCSLCFHKEQNIERKDIIGDIIWKCHFQRYHDPGMTFLTSSLLTEYICSSWQSSCCDCSLYVMYCHLEGLVRVVLGGTMGSFRLTHSVMKKQFYRGVSILNWNLDILLGMILNWNSSDWHTVLIIWGFFCYCLD